LTEASYAAEDSGKRGELTRQIMSLRVRPEPEQGGLPSRLEDIPPNRPHGACFRVSLPR
jgi:hypothetical protein